MGAAFLVLRELDVAGFVADLDPNVTDPDTGSVKSIVLPVRPIDAELASVNNLIAHGGYTPKTPAVTIGYELYIKDDATGVWLLVGAFPATPVFTPKTVKVAPGARLFARITTVDGGAPPAGKAFVVGLPTP
jgi:hypothetical protein